MFLKTDPQIRVRFAPSPTGPLHIGGVRTALYNFLFARKNHGTFILRIEDTDRVRTVTGAEEYIMDSLNWCGIHPDESTVTGGPHAPYRQSERNEIYQEYALRLVNNGFAYYAFDTAAELEVMRNRMKAAGMTTPQYNAITREHMSNSLTLSKEDVEKRIEAGEPCVIRVKIPRNEDIKMNDLVRGWITVHSSKLDDKVLLKADGMPTYHLANVVDDHLMEISHVIRGEEWLPSLPLHVLLYRWFDWKMPEFAHLPLLMRPDGKGKLSKRDGDQLGFPVYPRKWTDPETGEISSGFKEKGFIPEAFINMLAFLGWNPGTTQEIFSMDELINAFSLERVGKSGCRFDPEKAKWFNQQYLREQSDEQIAGELSPMLEREGIKAETGYIAKVCRLMKERATFTADMLEGIYFFRKPEKYDEVLLNKKWRNDTPEHLQELLTALTNIVEFNAETMEKSVKEFIHQKRLNQGDIFPVLRVLITGVSTGPSVFEIAALLGRDETVARIKSMIN